MSEMIANFRLPIANLVIAVIAHQIGNRQLAIGN
jgi:hypothetical protein